MKSTVYSPAISHNAHPSLSHSASLLHAPPPPLRSSSPLLTALLTALPPPHCPPLPCLEPLPHTPPPPSAVPLPPSMPQQPSHLVQVIHSALDGGADVDVEHRRPVLVGQQVPAQILVVDLASRQGLDLGGGSGHTCHVWKYGSGVKKLHTFQSNCDWASYDSRPTSAQDFLAVI